MDDNIDNLGFDGFDAVEVVFGEFDDWFDFGFVGEVEPFFGSEEGDEFEGFSLVIFDVETEMVLVGAHCADFGDLDVFEAKNGFFVA